MGINTYKNVVAIVAAAGRGVRLKSPIPKPLIILDKEPLIIHTLRSLSRISCISRIIVAVNQKDFTEIKGKIKTRNLDSLTRLVLGGRTRRQSVENALGEIPAKTDLVLIHDCARPFIDKEIILRAIKEAGKFGAAVVAVPIKSTLKQIKKLRFRPYKKQYTFVVKTIDREKIWDIQTPQVFKKDLILEAYRRFKDKNVTDDASLVERLGVKISLVRGSYFNIKITTPEDLVFARAIIESRKSKIENRKYKYDS